MVTIVGQALEALGAEQALLAVLLVQGCLAKGTSLIGRRNGAPAAGAEQTLDLNVLRNPNGQECATGAPHPVARLKRRDV